MNKRFNLDAFVYICVYISQEGETGCGVTQKFIKEHTLI